MQTLIVACQAPLSVAFSGQEHWSGMPCPPPRDLLNPGVEPVSLRLLHGQVGSSPLVPRGKLCWIKCQIVNALSSACRVVFVAVDLSCPWSVKVATDDVEANGCFVKLYLKTRWEDGFG